MNQTRYKLLVLALVMVFALAFTACGSKTPKMDPQSTATDQAGGSTTAPTTVATTTAAPTTAATTAAPTSAEASATTAAEKGANDGGQGGQNAATTSEAPAGSQAEQSSKEDSKVNIQIPGTTTSEGIPFTAEIFRIHNFGGGSFSPTILHDANEAAGFAKSLSGQFEIDQGYGGNSLAAQLQSYDAAFFAKHDVLVVYNQFNSGSIQWSVSGLVPEGQTLKIQTAVRGIGRGEVGTMDMAYYAAVIVVEKGALDKYEIEPLFSGGSNVAYR